MSDTGVTMPRMWALRDLRTQGGLSPDDLLVEITEVTFATTASTTVTTTFADGQIIAVLFGKLTSSAIQYSTSKTVTTATITVTATTTSAEVVSVVVIGKSQI